MRAAYNGIESLTFGDYINLETGKTLTAEPGGVYDIAPASGRAVQDIPGPWFTVLEGGEAGLVPAAGGIAAPEPAGGSLASGGVLGAEVFSVPEQ